MGSLFQQEREALFGTRGGAGPSTQQQTQFRPQDQASIQQAQQGLQGQVGQFQQQQQALQQQALANVPQLGQISQAQFGEALDPRAQALVAQGRQGVLAQAGRRRQEVSSQFRGAPGVSRALQAQLATQSALQQNPLLFQASREQTGRQAVQNRQLLATQQAANQALIQQAQAQRLALGQAGGFQGAGLASAGGLLQALLRTGQAQGTTTKTTQQPGTSGLFGGK